MLRKSLEYLRASFDANASTHPNLKHMLVETRNAEAFDEANIAVPFVFQTDNRLIRIFWRDKREIQVFIDENFDCGQEAYEAFWPLAESAVEMLAACGLLQSEDPPPDPSGPAFFEVKKTHFAKQWMVFVHRFANAHPGALPRLASAPCVEHLPLKKGGVANSLTPGVFKASSLVIETIMTDGIVSECPLQPTCEEPLDPDYVPAVDVLVELQQALWWFNDQGNVTSRPTFYQEEKLLPHIIRMADALRPIRPLLEKTEGWPTKMKRALRSLVEWFDALVSRWGWERVAESEPARSRYLKQCKDRVWEVFERPMHEAARSASDLWDESTPCPYDDMADVARNRGIEPTISTLEEAGSQFKIARCGFNSEPRIGRCYPEISYAEHQTFIASFASFNPCMMQVAPEPCARPRSEVFISQPKPDNTAPAPSRGDGHPAAVPTLETAPSSAWSETPPPAAPPVFLGQPPDKPKIRGIEAALLNQARYDVIKVLLDAWPSA